MDTLLHALLVHQKFRNDAGDMATPVNYRPCHFTHQAYAAAAIDQSHTCLCHLGTQ